MNTVLLDTHAWAWSLTADPRLSERALAALASAEVVYVSPISLYEIGQKIRIGKWPEMASWVNRLPDILRQQGAQVAPLSPETCLKAAVMEWSHRDPFDRFIAATCLEMDLPLVSADEAFDGLPGINRLW